MCKSRMRKEDKGQITQSYNKPLKMSAKQIIGFHTLSCSLPTQTGFTEDGKEKEIGHNKKENSTAQQSPH